MQQMGRRQRGKDKQILEGERGGQRDRQRLRQRDKDRETETERGGVRETQTERERETERESSVKPKLVSVRSEKPIFETVPVFA